jgi:hypothetical protein
MHRTAFRVKPRYGADLLVALAGLPELGQATVDVVLEIAN